MKLELSHQALRPYQRPRPRRSAFELAVTVLPFMGLWLAAWGAYRLGFWWAAPLISLPAGGFLLRLFAIQHDCGHRAFFNDTKANDWIGRVLGVLTLTPYDVWRRKHAAHHAAAGDLERRGVGDVDTLTVREYNALGRVGRLRYRLYRHPAIVIFLGPAYLFLLEHRLPVGLMRDGWRPWLSVTFTNGGIAALVGGLVWLVGLGPFVLIHLPMTLLAVFAGGWLFYIQHQFERTSWTSHQSWNHAEAALHGSSYYDLPLVLRWWTANIGIHHVHHLSSRIPYYNLPRVLRDYPALRRIGRLTLGESLSCLSLSLWDEDLNRLVSFRAARKSART